MKHEIEDGGLSIVVLGDFNPRIINPLWLSDQNLIRPAEGDEVDLKFKTRQFCSFSVSGLDVQVTQERLIAGATSDEFTQPLRDLVIGIFQILHHTPIKAFGLNSDQHFKMNSEADWHKVGHHYAPKSDWSAVLDDPRTLVVEVQGQRSDTLADKVSLRLEPSREVPHGVYFRINQHYDMPLGPDKSPLPNYELFAEKLNADWNGFLTYRGNAGDHLLNAALNPS